MMLLVGSWSACGIQGADSPDQPDRDHPRDRGVSLPSACDAVGVVTIAAARGSSAIDVSVLSTAQTDPMTVAITRHDFVEVQQRQPMGLEQSWRFDRPTGQSGDLRIVVRLPALHYIGRTPAGQHFQGQGCDAWYGDGSWIDAAGHRLAIPARVENGDIILVVPARIATASAYPAVLDPVIVVDPLT